MPFKDAIFLLQVCLPITLICDDIEKSVLKFRIFLADPTTPFKNENEFNW